MGIRWNGVAIAVLVGLSLVLAGCSQSPLSPNDPSQNSGTSSASSAPPIVSFAADGSVDYVSAPVEDEVGTVVNQVMALPASLTGSAKIDGSLGGVVRAGRFTIKVPAGAFTGIAVITMSVPDSTVMLCDLSISPSTANHFKVPVVLTADITSASLTDASTFTTYWYDPARLTWVSLLARSRTSGSTIVTNLEHFSRYASGKAGW